MKLSFTSRTTFALVLAGFLLSIACNLLDRGERSRPAEPISETEARAAYERVAGFLPQSLAGFEATGAASMGTMLQNGKVWASRRYETEGRSLDIEINTGNVADLNQIVNQERAHAFGSDTPTYWRTVKIAGFRGRIAEENNSMTSSEIYLSLGNKAVLRLKVAPRAFDGESAELVKKLNLQGIPH